MNAYGHTLVVPKAHCERLWDIDRQDLANLMAAVQELCLRYRSRFGATGFTLLHASGAAAQQSVPHVHLHLLPRFAGDGLDAWPPLPPLQVDRADLMTRLGSFAP